MSSQSKQSGKCLTIAVTIVYFLSLAAILISANTPAAWLPAHWGH